jgi:hypothetical protein
MDCEILRVIYCSVALCESTVKLCAITLAGLKMESGEKAVNILSVQGPDKNYGIVGNLYSKTKVSNPYPVVFRLPQDFF